jgi:DNA helicase-4
VDLRHMSKCSNPSCGESIKICELCGRPMRRRNSKYGEFWGCSGYGIKDDQCTNTVQA